MRTIYTIADERLARLVIVLRRWVVTKRSIELGLRRRFDEGIEIGAPEASATVLAGLVAPCYALSGRRGVTVADAECHIYRRPSVAAAMLLATGPADAALVGGNGDGS